MSSNAIDNGATAVIYHHIREGQHEAYNAWTQEISHICATYPGRLDLQIIRPISNISAKYTLIIRFDTYDHLQAWMESEDRKRLIEKVRPLLAKDDNFVVQNGLNFWFLPPGSTAKVPIRWKQFLVTWSAIYPTVLGTSWAVESIIQRLNSPENPYIKTLCITFIVVMLMVYVIMPRYTALVRKWLFCK